MDHGHPHPSSSTPDHGHVHATAAADARRLRWALILAASYMLAEVIGGYLTGSLALLADAGHMLSDAGALALALFALRIGARPPDDRRTFGYQRSEVLAALAHGVTLVAVAAVIVWEAIERLREPRPVDGAGLILIAAGGLLVNAAGLAILSGGRGHSLNMKGAWLHVLSDALGSVQAIVAGALIYAFGWTWADPLASALIALLVAGSSWHLLRESVSVLMEGSPSHLDVRELEREIRDAGGVLDVHDLHVWSIGSRRVSLSVHVTVGEDESSAGVLNDLRARLAERYGIRHSTIQLEPPGVERCDGCS